MDLPFDIHAGAPKRQGLPQHHAAAAFASLGRRVFAWWRSDAAPDVIGLQQYRDTVASVQRDRRRTTLRRRFD